MNSKEIASEICSTLYQKKAEDILIIDIKDKTIIADMFVIATGKTNSHVKALCDEVEFYMEGLGVEAARKEGYAQGRWIVMDYAGVLVHIFHSEEREYYNLERLWIDDDNCEEYPPQTQPET